MKHQKPNYKEILLLSVIILSAIILRLWFLEKPGGMWFDEMNTYLEAKLPLERMLEVFFNKHIHTPLFYVFLHFWMNLLGESDFIIRLLPAIFGILTIPVVYLCGKELKCEKTALTAAFFTAINSLLIYYSQEVRMYSLTALFSALIVLFLLRLNRSGSLFNISGLILANAGLLYTHSISFVFVFFEFFIFGLYFFFKNRDKIKPFLYTAFFTALLYMPYVYLRFFNFIKAAETSGAASQWWKTFTFSKIFFAFTDSFSPFLLAWSYPPDSFITFMFQTPLFAVLFSVFVILPALIGLTGILNSFLKGKTINLLIFLVCAGFVFVFTIVSYQGKVVYLSRYIIEVTPLYLLLAAHGLCGINNKIISKILIYTFAGINLGFILFLPISAPKQDRELGLKPPADIINKHNFSKNDIFISLGYKKPYFKKYLSKNGVDSFYHIDNWNMYKFKFFLKGAFSLKDITDSGYCRLNLVLPDNRPAGSCEKLKTLNAEIMGSKNYRQYLGHKDRKKFYYRAFSPFITGGNLFEESNLKREIFSQLNDDNNLVFIIDINLAKYMSPEENQRIKNLAQNNPQELKKIPLMFVLYSRTAHDLLEITKNNLNLQKTEQADIWKIYIFKKQRSRLNE